ncbi:MULTISPECIES: hypothetical protein [Asticcacaulis]|uniref:hypothetical protein n=1 Tax=Asticcacaulis TaxID=76890 RepID=UPI001AE5814C|nr:MULTISPECIES: hypothetical protein [Asticcacaulis]MBP2159018.1 hypothetical protein [Asticcacaulis solisilvae]MDR6800063.1 hypothetical protein [Asticcacaulis sp. BE141]
MLKAVLSILAVIGLLLSPIHAQAANADCMAMSSKMQAVAPAMATMDMSSCCEKDTGKTSDNHKDKACIENCIAMCSLGSVVASPNEVILPVLAVEQVTFNDKAAPLFTQEPGLFVPPPKSQA